MPTEGALSPCASEVQQEGSTVCLGRQWRVWEGLPEARSWRTGDWGLGRDTAGAGQSRAGAKARRQEGPRACQGLQEGLQPGVRAGS